MWRRYLNSLWRDRPTPPLGRRQNPTTSAVGPGGIVYELHLLEDFWWGVQTVAHECKFSSGVWGYGADPEDAFADCVANAHRHPCLSGLAYMLRWLRRMGFDPDKHKRRHVALAGDCFDCGDTVRIVTNADQHRDKHAWDDGSWFAFDGDTGACIACGAPHYVSCCSEAGATLYRCDP